MHMNFNSYRHNFNISFAQCSFYFDTLLSGMQAVLNRTRFHVFLPLLFAKSSSAVYVLRNPVKGMNDRMWSVTSHSEVAVFGLSQPRNQYHVLSFNNVGRVTSPTAGFLAITRIAGRAGGRRHVNDYLQRIRRLSRVHRERRRRFYQNRH